MRFLKTENGRRGEKQSMIKLRFVVLFLVLAFVVFPSATFADQAQKENEEGICQQWGINIWGLSYHTDKSDRGFKVNSANWGIGVGCYKRPEWKWLGKSEDNKVFLQTDAMLNSYNGLLVLASSGVEYKLTTIFSGCKVFVDAALTMAYYQNPIKKKSEIKFGPVPGLALGCGNLKSNIVFIPSVDKNHLAAVVASFSVLF